MKSLHEYAGSYIGEPNLSIVGVPIVKNGAIRAVPITLPRYIVAIFNEDPVPSSPWGAVFTTLLSTGPPAHPQKKPIQNKPRRRGINPVIGFISIKILVTAMMNADYAIANGLHQYYLT